MSASNENNEQLKRKSERENKEEDSKKKKKNFENENDDSEKEEEIECEVSSDKVIYFKIVSNEKEFKDFQELDFVNTFQPTYTYELFPNSKIHGYKGLKILISLTPKTFFAHLNIIYSKQLLIHDDIQKVLTEHFQDRQTMDKNIFLEKLEQEQKLIFSKGKQIYKNNSKAIYNIDIINDNFLPENHSLQSLCTFFIDAASFIPIETNFWNYFLLIEYFNPYAEDERHIYLKNNEEDDAKNWHVIGFSSYKNFHFELNKYNSMISQFLILPPYQRKGYGTLLLENCYKFLYSKEECREITTEDPSIEFILMRDYTWCKIFFDEKIFDDLLSKINGKIITTENEYNLFILTKEKLDMMMQKFKLESNVIEREFEIIKYCLVMNTKLLIDKFSEEKKQKLIKQIKDSSFKESNKKREKGPFISFYDEPDYDGIKGLKEIENETEEFPAEKRVEMLFPEYIGDISKITEKISGLICKYHDKLNSKK